jgi:MFS family permease
MIHFTSVIFSALAGASLIDRIKRRSSFLIVWMIFGILSTLSLMFIDSGNTLNISLLSLLFGVSFGLGTPVSLGYFADHTTIGNRAKLGGLIMLVNGLGVFLPRILIGDIMLQPITLAVWRAAGLLMFLMVKLSEEDFKEEKRVSYNSILNQRPFMLYLIPWLMFSLINELSASILYEVHPGMVTLFAIIEGVLAGAFSILGGFMADIIGRKRVTITGFVLLGLGYAMLGIYPTSLVLWFFYTIVDGIAWGIFSLIFITTVWGDLSHSAPSDKYYAVGGTPFFLSNLLRFLVTDYVKAISPEAIFSLTAFFLFLAVLPLMFAPETLPEKKIKERELKIYVERAKEIKKKYY